MGGIVGTGFGSAKTGSITARARMKGVVNCISERVVEQCTMINQICGGCWFLYLSSGCPFIAHHDHSGVYRPNGFLK
jgi:hypothetical protein